MGGYARKLGEFRRFYLTVRLQVAKLSFQTKHGEREKVLLDARQVDRNPASSGRRCA